MDLAESTQPTVASSDLTELASGAIVCGTILLR